MSSHYCPQCGRFKPESFPLCNECAKLEEANNKDETTQSKDSKKEKIAKVIHTEEYATEGNRLCNKLNDKNTYICKCGIYVKREGEKAIADFLTENNIQFFYEKKCQYYILNAQWNSLRVKSIYPDFFIDGPVIFQNRPIENVYIEYWDQDTPEYLERKAHELNVYKHNSCTVINLYPEDLKDIKNALTKKLTEFTDRQINY